ncbi:MAG: molybdopterin molybdotransferase MoeA [Phycisphaerales bacterium]|nr:molybdopterin molybdotransferase MoeA [Phycisphaerales bacterium]
MSPLPDYLEAINACCNWPWANMDSEQVDLTDAMGRTLVEPIVADRDLPPFNRAAMDGYAVRLEDLQSTSALPLAGMIAAGDSSSPVIPPGYCTSIATGAPVPDQLDTVIPHEWTDRGDPVHIQRTPERGHAIHRQGSDALRNQELVAAGCILGAPEIGLAATVGHSSLQVRRQPTVAILSSGNEVVSVDTTPEPHQIRNSNLPMVSSLMNAMGARTIAASWLADDLEATMEALSRSIHEADLVVTIGGISAGDRDMIRTAIDSVKGEVILAGAAIQPGRPIRMAAMQKPNGTTPVVSLPGNPVSALATACLFAWPIVSRLLGGDGSLPWTEGILAEPTQRHAVRRRFRPVQRTTDGRLAVPHWQGSGDLAHAANTIGLVDLACGEQDLPVNTTVRWLPWP